MSPPPQRWPVIVIRADAVIDQPLVPVLMTRRRFRADRRKCRWPLAARMCSVPARRATAAAVRHRRHWHARLPRLRTRRTRRRFLEGAPQARDTLCLRRLAGQPAGRRVAHVHGHLQGRDRSRHQASLAGARLSCHARASRALGVTPNMVTIVAALSYGSRLLAVSRRPLRLGISPPPG